MRCCTKCGRPESTESDCPDAIDDQHVFPPTITDRAIAHLDKAREHYIAMWKAADPDRARYITFTPDENLVVQLALLMAVLEAKA